MPSNVLFSVSTAVAVIAIPYLVSVIYVAAPFPPPDEAESQEKVPCDGPEHCPENNFHSDASAIAIPIVKNTINVSRNGHQTARTSRKRFITTPESPLCRE